MVKRASILLLMYGFAVTICGAEDYLPSHEISLADAEIIHFELSRAVSLATPRFQVEHIGPLANVGKSAMMQVPPSAEVSWRISEKRESGETGNGVELFIRLVRDGGDQFNVLTSVKFRFLIEQQGDVNEASPDLNAVRRAVRNLAIPAP